MTVSAAQADHNQYIPNSYQTPNVLVDRLMPLLHPDEWVALSFAVRHILGWTDRIASRRARISLSLFLESGLTMTSLRKALDNLDHFRILRRIGEPTQQGQLWELAFDDPTIDWEGLEARKQAEAVRARRKTAKARRTALTKRKQARPSVPQNTDPSVGQNTGGSVPQHTEGFCGTEQEPSVPQKKVGLSHRKNQTHHDDDELESISESMITSSSEGADPEAAAANLAAGDNDDWKLVEPEAVKISFWKSKLPLLRAREPARALALVWDAQDRGQSNPAGLLAAMLDNEQEPPEKLVEAAQVWLEHGGEYTRDQADRAARHRGDPRFSSGTGESPDPPAPEPAAPDGSQNADGSDTPPAPDIIDDEAQRLSDLAAAWQRAIPLMVERTRQAWWEDTTAVPASDFGLEIRVPAKHVAAAEQRRILATNMLQNAGWDGFVQTVTALPAAEEVPTDPAVPGDENLPDWNVTWAAVVERLRPRLEPATFDDGLKVSRVSGYADGMLTVKAPDPDGPLTNLHYVIEQVLRDVAGQRVRVKFEPAPAAATVGGGA